MEDNKPIVVHHKPTKQNKGPTLNKMYEIKERIPEPPPLSQKEIFGVGSNDKSIKQKEEPSSNSQKTKKKKRRRKKRRK